MSYFGSRSFYLIRSSSLAQPALLEVGAVGLGTLVTIAVLSSTLDITGILAASTQARLRQTISELRSRSQAVVVK
jgi:hypothetical protein